MTKNAAKHRRTIAALSVVAILLCTEHTLAAGRDSRLKGYDITQTGLTPGYPPGYACSPLTSLYASWIDVDGGSRDKPHSGVDGGRLGEPVLAPAGGIVRRVWVADWGQGREGALLIRHSRRDLNLASGPPFYYSAFYHLRYRDIRRLRPGQRIERGQPIGSVWRPGGRPRFLPEVHLEVYEVWRDQPPAMRWGVGARGTEYFENAASRLIDPLYLMSLELRPDAERKVPIQPFVEGRDYSAFKGFTYFLPCRQQSRQGS